MRIVTTPFAALAFLSILAVAPSTARAQAPQPAQPLPAGGQQETDARWMAWVGCWQSMVEIAPGDDTRLCVVPGDGGSGIRMLTLAGGETVLDETMLPDGADRAVNEALCKGVRRAEWARDGNMLFTRANLTCENRPARKVSGLQLLTAGPVWLDIRVAEAGGRTAVDVRRYQRASVPESIAALLPAGLMVRAESATVVLSMRPLTPADVIESTAKVSSQAVEAALFETNAHFALNKRVLVALDDAGVADEVIDLMLALSYPARFAVDRPSSSAFAGADLFPFSDMGWGWLGYLDSWSSLRRSSNCYDGYDSFGNYYGGRWNYDNGTRPYYGGPGSYYECSHDNRWSLIGPSGSGSFNSPGSDGPPASGTGTSSGGGGAVVNGQGYTRVRPSGGSESRPSSAAAARSGNSGSDSAVAPSSSSGALSTDSSSGGSSSAGASPAGYSPSSSGTDSGRTAVGRE